MKKNNKQDYGKELGYRIKEGLKGLNTVASPKSKKKCEKLMIIPLIIFVIGIISIMLGADSDNPITIIGILSGFGLGLYQFYIGKFKKGLIYTITFGFFTIGILFDLFKLKVTHTLTDSNGFPLIY